MILIRLLRFVVGYVGFTACGGFPERFINLCSLKRITLWELKSKAGTISANTDAKSYPRLRKIAGKSGMKLHITKKAGLPFILKKHRDRIGIPIGAALFALIFAALSGRIWTVTSSGSSKVPASAIIETAGSLGILPGAKKKNISAASVSSEALSRLPGLSWLYVNISGCRAVIEVRETSEKPVRQEEIKSDLVAAKTGRLTTLRVFNGTPLVSPGSAVIKGDVLISGVEENRDGSSDIGSADGYAEALISHSFSSAAQKKEKFVFRSKVTDSPGLILFSGRITPFLTEGSPGFTEDRFLKVNGTVLPFGVTRTVSRSAAKKTVCLSPVQAKLLALSRLCGQISDEVRHSGITEKSFEYKTGSSGAEFSAEFTCIENIGAKRAIRLSETD